MIYKLAIMIHLEFLDMTFKLLTILKKGANLDILAMFKYDLYAINYY